MFFRSYFVRMPYKTPVEIPLKGREGAIPSQYAEKTDMWAYRNVEYFLTFYNRRLGNVSNVFAGDRTSAVLTEQRLNPVQHMIRMMLYYLGEQPNMDYAFVNDDLTQTTMQSMWIRNQSVKEFVDYFKGNMITRITNAEWTGRPLSERATSERTDAWNKYMMAYDLKPYLKQIAEQFGMETNAGQQDFELPQQVKEFMEKTWKENGAELAGNIANGIWFSQGWWDKVLQSFMNIVITATGAMHHYTQNGVAKQEVVQPYELIFDNRSTNDYGKDDAFIGKVKLYTLTELFSRFPEFTPEQRQQIENTASSENLRGTYNINSNILWWAGQSKRNTVAVVEMYWRTKHPTGKKLVKNEKGFEKIARAEEEDEQFIDDDIYQATLVGNKYLLRTGYIDNLVEEFDDVSRPMMPIIRFRPNTFLGESVSEVSRISKIVDEIDYLDYKMREMVGKAKGKIYWINGDKFDEGQGFRGFLENVSSMGIHVGMPSGEDEQQGKAVELIDWTLDPNIDKLWTLVKEKEERMKKIMSTSDIAMGQQQSYTGYKTSQNTIAQNALGTAYLFDGTLEWVTLNMRYAANVQKNLYVSNDTLDASIVVGDRGVVQLKLFKELTFEQLYVQLNINDQMDEEQKKRITDIALAAAQNSQISLLDYLSIESANSVTEAKNRIEYSIKETENKQQKAQAAGSQEQVQQIAAEKFYEAQLIQLKEDNANYRADVAALTKNVELLLKQMQQAPPTSPIEQQMAQANQPQQGQMQPQQGQMQ